MQITQLKQNDDSNQSTHVKSLTAQTTNSSDCDDTTHCYAYSEKTMTSELAVSDSKDLAQFTDSISGSQEGTHCCECIICMIVCVHNHGHNYY